MHSLCIKPKKRASWQCWWPNFGCRVNKIKASAEIPASAPAVAPELQVGGDTGGKFGEPVPWVPPPAAVQKALCLGSTRGTSPRAPCPAAASLWDWIRNICLPKSPRFSKAEPASPSHLCPPEKHVRARAVPLMSAAVVTAMISCQ